MVPNNFLIIIWRLVSLKTDIFGASLTGAGTQGVRPPCLGVKTQHKVRLRLVVFCLIYNGLKISWVGFVFLNKHLSSEATTGEMC